jgi:SAM-dependent methyltransferase
VADLPFEPADAGSTQRLLRAVDTEGKIPRALEAHGSFAGLDVVLFGASPGRARWLMEVGARLTVAAGAGADPAAELAADPAAELAADPDWPSDASADVVVSFWSAFDGPDRAEQLAHAQRLLRPKGRLLVVLDYGRDDLDVVRGPERTASLVAWSRRDGWFLSRGFHIRVIHTFWRFETIEEGGELLRAAYGPAAEPAISRLHRPRLAHNVAVYHWTRDSGASSGPARRAAAAAAAKSAHRAAPKSAAPRPGAAAKSALGAAAKPEPTAAAVKPGPRAASAEPAPRAASEPKSTP